ncbi:hypothetical protein DU48_00520 [Methanosarcina mazei]|uniref:Uncharacterized protein n=1 Tax=Methanosarcina mazei TaxID=2209 RepID=A0A0F8EAA9_METMZ|nr:hypothetical protein DU34_16295 [Methanosarcina mazei]KKG34776.1 hypothetical protein DU49_08065 [Methanosarcina mazei]KKG37577.1 hypothetical protein DU35_08920 [Methanosarcina mazei]KKG40292.1 hypothetical protein DU41_10695 [Methanosarcina mazei]KKG43887.1 hypothetical protein DU39_04650 [Methanosarcina mazei]
MRRTWIIDLLTMLTVISEAEVTKKLHQYCGKKVAFRKKTSSIHELLINSDKKDIFALFV